MMALLFAAMIVLEIGIQEHVLMPSFAQLERDHAFTSMRRVENTLSNELSNLQVNATDWGDWADVYNFAQAPTSEFVTTNITAAALKQLQVNTVVIVDLKGNVLVASTHDLDSGAPLNIDFAAEKSLPEDFPWHRNLTEGIQATGLIDTSQGIMMLACAPILNGTAGGRWVGMVILGKLLTPWQLRRIGARARVELSMVPTHPSSGASQLVETDTMTQISQSFTDIYGKPLLTLRVEVPREIVAHGRTVVTYAAGCLIGTGVAALILLVVVLNRVVLAPLDRVTRLAVAIGEGTDLTARLDMPGSDEMAVLAREFDRMVERLADSRRQLVDQSFQAGFAELAKGVVHNLGNAMTPLGVRLSKLGERLRDVPVADVELAAAELAKEVHGSQRYADLQEFLHLGCREMRSVLNDVQADVMVIQRQSVVVQTALADLMRSTRNEHVVESIRLPDLVSQTLEIVPDACRQRLEVEADESLRRVGVVRVARTVLRLVLQNLIINAADSVRDAGRDRGVLRFAAEIVRGSDHDQLHLCCEDDGVGIEKINLERVFDHGFSTKSRATNHGIGLHWCANAIAALGGRIWAASDGPGHGASMHLMLPLTVRPKNS